MKGNLPTFSEWLVSKGLSAQNEVKKIYAKPYIPGAAPPFKDKWAKVRELGAPEHLIRRLKGDRLTPEQAYNGLVSRGYGKAAKNSSAQTPK